MLEGLVGALVSARADMYARISNLADGVKTCADGVARIDGVVTQLTTQVTQVETVLSTLEQASVLRGEQDAPLKQLATDVENAARSASQVQASLRILEARVQVNEEDLEQIKRLDEARNAREVRSYTREIIALKKRCEFAQWRTSTSADAAPGTPRQSWASNISWSGLVAFVTSVANPLAVYRQMVTERKAEAHGQRDTLKEIETDKDAVGTQP
ncbi:hypothetical protein Rhopal_006661-T1 [Rhodotorula paludigena]|uniref:Uncharacterized protein n=1 Tax=Rhodotorula paludigena TaxID=86838 RepID=A0AAV5GWP5_9BASI|nr:hypothetical protein Rhopal_006661-T1 [Rhodotorula paludigena]